MRRVNSRALRAASRARAASMLLSTIFLAAAGVHLEELAELLVDDRLDLARDLGVPEFGLGLALELRLGDLDGNDRGQALAAVLAGQRDVLGILSEVALGDVGVDRPGQCRAETRQVCAALDRVDRVGERVKLLVVRIVPLQPDLEDVYSRLSPSM